MTSLRHILRPTRTITFDCYGTLIDWNAGLGRAFVDAFGPAAERRAGELFAAYVQIEAEIEAGPYRRYREVLAEVLVRLAERFGFDLPADRRYALAESLPGWRPFADTNQALAKLKRRFQLGVLSNVDRDLFAGTARQFDTPFDFVITAEDVQGYKPAHGHFQRLIESSGGPETVLHVAQSLFHDGRPAAALGLAFAWINRYKDPPDKHVPVLAEFEDLRSLAEAACGG